MQLFEMTILNAPRAFPHASPWVKMHTPEGRHSVRGFVHSNGYAYLTDCDLGHYAGITLGNRARVTEMFGPAHLMHIPVPRSEMPLYVTSEVGLAYVLARNNNGALSAEAAKALRWLVLVAAPGLRQRLVAAQHARALAAARAAVWDAV